MRNIVFLSLLFSAPSYALEPSTDSDDEMGAAVVAVASASHSKVDPTTINIWGQSKNYPEFLL